MKVYDLSKPNSPEDAYTFYRDIMRANGPILEPMCGTGRWRGSVWPKSNGQKINLSGLAALQDNICISLRKYELMEAGRIIHTEIEELKVRVYQQDKLIEMLKSAGFERIRTLKALSIFFAF